MTGVFMPAWNVGFSVLRSGLKDTYGGSQWLLGVKSDCSDVPCMQMGSSLSRP